MDDHRLKPRMHRRVPIKVELVFEGDATGEGLLCEMSEGGMSFETADDIAEGAVLRFLLSDDQERFAVEGRIVYARHLDTGRRYGVQFGSLPPSQSVTIRDFIRRHRFHHFRL